MIDIRIMAHPSRAENVAKIREALNLPEDAISWAVMDGSSSPMATARMAWNAPIPDGCTHRIVIQDDAEICNGFLCIAEKAAAKHPDEIVTFFHMGELPDGERYQEYMLSVGVALMLPVKLIAKFFHYIDNDIHRYCAKELLPDLLKADTSCMRSWARNRHIRCVTTVPTLVQHIGDESLVGINRRRVATDYTKKPPKSGW